MGGVKENDMAERLTRNNKVNFYFHDEASNMVYYKLQDLEDIMEKYDIESFELLEHIIKKGKVINSVIEDFVKEKYDKMKQDQNTWQRACELMGKKLLELYCSDYCGNNKDCNNCKFKDITSPQYFYQQAKNKDSKQC